MLSWSTLLSKKVCQMAHDRLIGLGACVRAGCVGAICIQAIFTFIFGWLLAFGSTLLIFLQILMITLPFACVVGVTAGVCSWGLSGYACSRPAYKSGAISMLIGDILARSVSTILYTLARHDLEYRLFALLSPTIVGVIAALGMSLIIIVHRRISQALFAE